jgi:hypothetical protein
MRSRAGEHRDEAGQSPLNARRQIGRNFDDQDASAPVKRAVEIVFNQLTDPAGRAPFSPPSGLASPPANRKTIHCTLRLPDDVRLSMRTALTEYTDTN